MIVSNWSKPEMEKEKKKNTNWIEIIVKKRNVTKQYKKVQERGMLDAKDRCLATGFNTKLHMQF